MPSKADQVQGLLTEGVPIGQIAKDLGISLGYVSTIASVARNMKQVADAPFSVEPLSAMPAASKRKGHYDQILEAVGALGPDQCLCLRYPANKNRKAWASAIRDALRMRHIAATTRTEGDNLWIARK